MSIPDYIPDVETPKKPNSMASQSAPVNNGMPESIQELADAWVRSLPDPITFQQAATECAKVEAFGIKILDWLCSHGTCPPPDVIAPELMAEIRKVRTLKEGFISLTERGYGHVKWPKSDFRYQNMIAICRGMFNQADALVSKTAGQQSTWEKFNPKDYYDKKKKEVDTGFSFWKTALTFGLGILAVGTMADFIKSVKGRD